MSDNTGGMGVRASETRKKVDEALRVVEENILKNSSANRDILRRQISDKKSFDRLLNILDDATRKNGSIATVLSNISNLSTNLKNVAIEAASIIKRL
jgi:predicted RNA binding protein with dsRBD fold (UPF0201 family)